MTRLNKLISKLQLIIGMAPDKLFYEGQDITLKEPTDWILIGSGKHANGPKFNEIVKCVKYTTFYKGDWYIVVSGFGYENEYLEKMFVPVIQDDELEGMLNAIDELAIKPQMP